MRCIEKLPHSCGSSDALQVFEDGGEISGYCFACSTYIPDPYEDKPEGYRPEIIAKSEDQIQSEIEQISSLPSATVHERKLNAATLNHFGVRVGLSEQDGSTPAEMYFPFTHAGNVVAYKIKLLSIKRMWSVGTVRGADFFGWEQAIASGSKRLYITEGEEDAMAVWQALVKKQKGTEWEDNIPAVVSLISGATSAVSSLTKNSNRIKEFFKEVVLVFDNDEAGRQATEESLKVFPSATTVTLPSKDANACLIEGKEKALVNALLFKMDKPKNTRTVLLDTLVDRAVAPVKHGLSFPWPKLTQMTRGLRFGETYYFGAGVKMGKSDLANALAAHFATEHGLNIYMAKPEESILQSTRKLLGKVAGRIFHDHNIEYHEKDLREAAEKVRERIYFLDKYQHVGWSSLQQDIYDASQNNECKLVFIDPITNLTNGIDHSQSDTILRGVAQDLAAMAKDLDIAVFIFCHLKAPESGAPHERGGHVYSHQFAGSRAMMRSCNYMLGLEGNKSPEFSLEERNLRKLVMLEDREFGESGVIPLYWDYRTQMFNEV
jgi:twinkle protein